MTELLWRLPAYPMAGALQVLLATPPWRKNVRLAVRKVVMNARRRVLRAKLTRAYGDTPVPSRATRWGMLAEYLVSSGWRAYRKTDTSKRFGRGVDQAHFVKKRAKKLVRTSVHYALVSMHALSARARRIFRRVVYEVAMWTHRTGLRKHRGGTHPR